jgi:hypothetical protein
MNEHLIAEEITALRSRRIEGYNRLIELAEEQQSLLLQNRHSELAQNLSKFDPVLMELQQLDRKEDAFSQRIKQAGDKLEDTAHTETMDKLSGEPLMDRVNRLRNLTEMNTHLIKNLMNFANYTMGIVSKIASNGRNFGDIGNLSVLLDLKV